MEKTILISLALAILLISLAVPVSAMNKAELVEAIVSDAGLTVSASGTGNLYEEVLSANKAELIEAIVSNAGLTKADARRPTYSNIVLERAVFHEKNGKIISHIGHVDHGKSISKRKARTGRNPQTGATIQIPAKKVVRFKAGADLAKTVA